MNVNIRDQHDSYVMSIERGISKKRAVELAASINVLLARLHAHWVARAEDGD